MPAALATQPAVKTSLADWTADDDDVNGFYAGEKRQRGGRKKRRKNKEAVVVQDWDDIYDPSRPNNFEEYKDSDEQFREIREWKERLYAHRTRRRHSSSCMSSDEEDRGRTRMRGSSALVDVAPYAVLTTVCYSSIRTTIQLLFRTTSGCGYRRRA